MTKMENKDHSVFDLKLFEEARKTLSESTGFKPKVTRFETVGDRVFCYSDDGFVLSMSVDEFEKLKPGQDKK